MKQKKLKTSTKKVSSKGLQIDDLLDILEKMSEKSDKKIQKIAKMAEEKWNEFYRDKYAF